MLNKKTPSRQAEGIEPKRQKLVYHTPNQNRYFREHRNRLLSELVALDGLPTEELRKRYYEIHPHLPPLVVKRTFQKF